MLPSQGRYPAWLLLLFGYLLTAVVGYIDFLTGDYSMLIFYFLPVCFGAWFLGRWGAVLISLGAGVARYVSDYHSYSASAVRYWNSFQDTAFLLMAGILIATVRKLLSDERGSPD